MKSQQSPQYHLFKIPLNQLCDSQNSLYRLADTINWQAFEEKFGQFYCEDNGRPAKPIRLMVGLHYLKATFGESDETVVEKWVENPYWQYFCGEKEFQHEFPLDPTSLVKWRRRIKSAGLETLLSETIASGLKLRVIKKQDIKRVNVDTTVMEKAITFPTDAKLYHKMRERLVNKAKELGIVLRQTYTRKSKTSLLMQNRYRHARQIKRAKRELRKLKTYLGRVTRDLDRQTKETQSKNKSLTILLELSYRLLAQQRKDTNKIYSLHAPEVECISKGKAHKKYEFGCKVSLVTSSKKNFILGAKAIHGNPYDGHTLEDALDQAEKLNPTKIKTEQVYCDRGYRGHKINQEGLEIHVVGNKRKNLRQSLRKWFKRRSAIEPVIGHMKNDNGPKRNHLLGKTGDEMNAILMACGYNMRKCLKALSFWLKYLLGLFKIIVIEPRKVNIRT